MNARESLAADRDAEECWQHAEATHRSTPTVDNLQLCADYLCAIAAELRAARVYANYLEGRSERMPWTKRAEKVAGPES